MALIKCPECGKEISDKAVSCPGCGMPLDEKGEERKCEDLLVCPKCLSEDIERYKKGFSGGKALAGAILTGPIGMLVGTIGMNNIECKCGICSHKFLGSKGILISTTKRKEVLNTFTAKAINEGDIEACTYLKEELNLDAMTAAEIGTNLIKVRHIEYKRPEKAQTQSNVIKNGIIIVILFVVIVMGAQYYKEYREHNRRVKLELRNKELKELMDADTIIEAVAVRVTDIPNDTLK